MHNEEAILERFGQGMGIKGLTFQGNGTALQIEEAWLFIVRQEEQLIAWIKGPLAFPSKERYEKILGMCDPRSHLPCPVHVGLSPEDHITFGATFHAGSLTLPEFERGIDVLLELFNKTQES